MRILIAEDDMMSRKLLTVVLKKRGHEVVTTCDGKEAWEAMQRSDPPRLAILDWMMPEMNGLEVCRRIRAIETDQPPYIIILTARPEKEDVVVGLESGANDYLAKPYTPGELQARVEVGQRTLELQAHLATKVRELQQALDHVKTLQGILPICCFCKRIRDDQDYWRQVEDYVTSHSEARFSHSVCPECMKREYPGYAQNVRGDVA